MDGHVTLKVFVYAVCVVGVVSYHVMFESFVQEAGFEIALFNIRVRKFNRTLSVVNGSVVVHDWVNNSLVFSLDLFHSRLGNQQFNHYPMKLPSSGCCNFIDHVHDYYGEYFESVENFPAEGECPFSPRTINVYNIAFPKDVVPLVMPRGLWKAQIVGRSDGQIAVSYYILVKFADHM
ncbi:uncharacterized protein LOC126560431 [Anopheles maculipalpis]|uniref:uncharacterized protein LOC126560431 n=1 Tax=Anopheles maculipalpis TaxID=1496333 RepID=UPI002158F95F|nr:uncharacterized protein LOC126560431 [Anopheles maculipalpis]